MTADRKYRFFWEDTIGVDLTNARPSLGPNLRLEAYRLFQFTLRDILEQVYGTESADDVFRRAGALAGRHFYERFCAGAESFSALVGKASQAFADLGMGILRVEGADGNRLVFTVTEDLDCSGMPEQSEVVCIYDEGLLQGLLEAFTGDNYAVREVDCWCTGARVCRFEAVAFPDGMGDRHGDEQ